MNCDNREILVSVICLAYNHEKYIRHTLEGFISQKTNFAFEVLINDDASTDGTADIIREYERNYPDIIKPVYQTVNQYTHGKKITQNFLCPKAKGKYFAWCEGDDYWCDENKLQKQFDIMEAHPECSICVHKVQCINEDGTLNERVIPEQYYDIGGGYQSDYDIADAIWINGSYPFHTSSYFVRRSAIYGYFDGTLQYLSYFNGDQNIIRTAFANGHVWYIDEDMSRRRLWSIGNWNSRFKALPDEEKIKFSMNKIKGEIAFDEYTDGRFHEWIVRFIARRTVEVSLGFHDKNVMKQVMNELGMSKHDILNKCPIQLKIRYIVNQLTPGLYNILKSIKHLIN